MAKKSVEKLVVAAFAVAAIQLFPAHAGEELMPMMPSAWSHPDASLHQPRPQLQRISSDDPRPRRAVEQGPARDMGKNVVKLKLPSLGTPKTAPQYRVVELEELAPGGFIDFDTAKSIPALPQDIPGLMPDTLTIDRYNQPVAAPRDSDMRDLVSFGDESDWLYGAGPGKLEPLSRQPLRRMPPPAQLELPPPLTAAAAPPAAPEEKRMEASLPLRPPGKTEVSLESLKPPPGFTTPTMNTPPPAVEKPIPMPSSPAFEPAPPVAIVQDNTVDVGELENVDGFVPIRALKVF